MSDVHALSGAYALDAVTDAERTKFERHLATCATCREEVDSLQETAAELTALTAEDPPPGLRASILEGIAGVRQLPPIVPVETAAVDERRRRTPRRLMFAAAAAAVVVGGVGVGIAQPWNDGPGSSQVVSATDQVLQATDAQHVSHKLAGGAQVTVTRSPSIGSAVIVTHDMPDAPAGESYVVWLQQDGKMVNAGAMPPGGDNTVLLKGDAATASAAGVTLESDPQATSPTTQPLAVFAF